MKLNKVQIIGIVSGIVIALLDVIFFFNDKNLFGFLIGIAVIVLTLPFLASIMYENKKETEMGEQFLEFTRNIAESVSTGTPISKSIINMRGNNYGALTRYVQKLGNQISVGIPVDVALDNFAREVDSNIISRAVSLIREAERSGGEIDYILDATAKSISEIEKLKKERKSAIYSLVVQGYIIFLIFIGIMLVMEFKIVPLIIGTGSYSSSGETGSIFGFGQMGVINAESLSAPFLYLLLAQGFFAGLIIGKLSEGKIKSGIKHSFILCALAFLISSGTRILFS